MSFINDKKQFLSKPDKSSAGCIDSAISSLVKKINLKENYYTTSSCAGRIVLMPETGKKSKNVFLKIWHEPISFNEFKEILYCSIKSYTGIIYLKHEPCIMHVACNSLEKALPLINLARQSGWKKSGIISIRPEKVVCELVSTEILAAPIAINKKVLADDNYLKTLISECNKKLVMTREKIRKFEKAL
ncbi:MAG: hypothetical protein QW041_01750 [Candidatus Pacearchaeota archaeon]